MAVAAAARLRATISDIAVVRMVATFALVVVECRTRRTQNGPREKIGVGRGCVSCANTTQKSQV
jgi:hypothetical protein